MRTTIKQGQIYRILILLAGFLAWFATILGRLVYLQILQHDDLTQRALRQGLDTIEVESPRGAIYDRKMHELAVTVDVQSAYAHPQEVADPAKLAAAAAPLLDMDYLVLEDKLSASKSFVWLKRKLDFSIEQKLLQAKLPGIRLIKESKRFFPHGELGAQVLGFVGMDNQGLDGLELLYDRELRGTPGLYLAQRDAKQQILGSEIRRPPIPGNTLVLNLDKNIQFIVEQQLASTVSEHAAQGASAVLMNPHNGQVLALANYPSYNPNFFAKYQSSYYRNRSVADVYEPGSTFKIVTIGSALEENQLDPAEQINCQMGSITLADHTVKDHIPFGYLDYSRIIAHSSNVGAIKIGLRMGAERFYQRITSFGIGYKSNIDIPGESAGLLRKPGAWSGVSNGYIAMGYEVGVTPLQMLLVLSAVANGGYWVKPQVVQKIISPEGELIHENLVERHKVLATRSVTLLQRALEMVVSEGTGKAAALDTYKVAGKTGTTKKQEEGGYSTSKYVASFVGYAPAANPAFAAIVVIDEPKGGAYYGGEVAAPVFKAIAEKVLRYLEVPPERQPAMELLAKIPARQAPSVTDTPVSMDRSEIDSAQLESGGTKPEIVIVNAEEPGAVMPDFRGKTLRSVMEKCAELGIELTYHGSGMAVDQSPRPGSRLAANNACKVWFARQAAGRLVTRNVPKDRVQSGKTNKAESIVVRKTIDSNRTNNSQDGTRE